MSDFQGLSSEENRKHIKYLEYICPIKGPNLQASNFSTEAEFNNIDFNFYICPFFSKKCD